MARDLIERKVTSPECLACIGGSNGGLLVGNMLTREGVATKKPCTGGCLSSKDLTGVSSGGARGDTGDDRKSSLPLGRLGVS